MKYVEQVDGETVVGEISVPVFSERYDVIVAGLGASGVFCAAAASEEGASVLGLERSGTVGGMTTIGSVNGYYFGGGGGAHSNVDAECEELKNTVFLPFGAFHPDARQYVMRRRLANAGVKTVFHAVIIGLYEENHRIVGVKAADRRRIYDIGCGMLVDATSEGHLIRMAGTNIAFGRETDGERQPFTCCRVYLKGNCGSMARTNQDSGYINQYDDVEFSRTAILSQAAHAPALLEPERTLHLAQQLGVREGIRFEGEHQLTLEEMLDGPSPDDVLIYAYSDLDRHGFDFAFDSDLYQDWMLACNLSTVNIRIAVPLGSLIPKGKKGIISIGRCLSVDSYVAAAVRMNRDMHRLGEAGGVVSAMAAATGDAGGIDREQLRRRLAARGCVHGTQERADFAHSSDGVLTDIVWPEDFSEIENILKTDCPGVAFRSCQRMGREALGDRLAELSESEEPLLRYNAAIALGIVGDCRALPLLRELVKTRELFFFKDCRRTNQLRSVIAIYLLGKLGDGVIVPELISILSPKEYENPIYHTMGPSYKFSIYENFNRIYFDHVSHAAAALRRIAKAVPERAPEIAAAFRRFSADENYFRRITCEPHGSSQHKTACRLADFIAAGCQEPLI